MIDTSRARHSESSTKGEANDTRCIRPAGAPPPYFYQDSCLVFFREFHAITFIIMKSI
uniref:Uncharacterized protein n=1 Tax=Anguilla anguilla TaxID=7936 RepID=A0A0E9W9Y0_ANGAN